MYSCTLLISADRSKLPIAEGAVKKNGALSLVRQPRQERAERTKCMDKAEEENKRLSMRQPDDIVLW